MTKYQIQYIFVWNRDSESGLRIFMRRSNQVGGLQQAVMHWFWWNNQETFLEVSGYVVGSSESTRSLAPEDRGCLFAEEGGLVHYSKYSYASCKFECLTETACEEVGCVPWYIPHGVDTESANPVRLLTSLRPSPASVVGTARGVMRQPLPDPVLKIRAWNKNLFRSCLPDCSPVIYSFIESSAAFRRCDSRNLNISPLCDLASLTKSQAIWGSSCRPPLISTGGKVRLDTETNLLVCIYNWLRTLFQTYVCVWCALSTT